MECRGGPELHADHPQFGTVVHGDEGVCPPPTELVVVMLVYNEEGCIQQVMDSWHDELSRLGIDFTLLILNDGSRDRTAEKLEKYANDRRVKVCQKANSGHGPTVSLGYRLAASQGASVTICRYSGYAGMAQKASHRSASLRYSARR